MISPVGRGGRLAEEDPPLVAYMPLPHAEPIINIYFYEKETRQKNPRRARTDPH